MQVPQGWQDPLTLAGFGLGLLSLILSILIYKLQKAAAHLYAEEESKRFESLGMLTGKLGGSVEFLGQTVSTRAIGPFPSNMKPITDLIVRAHKHLVIATDVVAYGQLSNPEAFSRYRAAIIDARSRGVEIQVMAYGGERARRERALQFGRYASKTEGDAPPALHAEPRWKAFARTYGIKHDLPNERALEALEYVDLMCRRELAVLHQTPVHEVRSVCENLPVFFWIGDGREAVFSLFTVGEQSRELSFRTEDHSIIEMLSTIFHRHLGSAVARPFDPHQDLSGYRPLVALAQAESSPGDEHLADFQIPAPTPSALQPGA